MNVSWRFREAKPPHPTRGSRCGGVQWLASVESHATQEGRTGSHHGHVGHNHKRRNALAVSQVPNVGELGVRINIRPTSVDGSRLMIGGRSQFISTNERTQGSCGPANSPASYHLLGSTVSISQDSQKASRFLQVFQGSFGNSTNRHFWGDIATHYGVVTMHQISPMSHCGVDAHAYRIWWNLSRN